MFQWWRASQHAARAIHRSTAAVVPTNVARMRAVRQFNVVPAIPEPLQALSELAANLHWTWDSETRALFRSLDPVAWRATGEDPLHVIAAVTATRWQELAADPAVVAATEAAAARQIGRAHV